VDKEVSIRPFQEQQSKSAAPNRRRFGVAGGGEYKFMLRGPTSLQTTLLWF
jgi:hypothetical protein